MYMCKYSMSRGSGAGRSRVKGKNVFYSVRDFSYS